MRNSKKRGLEAQPLPPAPQQAPPVRVKISLPPQKSLAPWIAMALGAYLIYRVAPMGYYNYVYWALSSYGLGAAVIFWGFARLPRLEAPLKDPYYAGRLVLLVCLAFFIRDGWSLFGQLELTGTVLLGLMWIYLYGQPLSRDQYDPGYRHSPAWAFWLATALALSGTWLRFHKIMEIPNGMHLDEIGTSNSFEMTFNHGVNVLTGINDSLCGSGTLLGQGVDTPVSWILAKRGYHGILNLRLTQAIFGSLLLPAFYIMMRIFFGWRPALWSLLFLAFSRYGIAGSRHMVYDSPRLLFICLAMICVGKGIRGNLLWFALAGAFTGLLLYGCHYPQYVIPFLIVIYLGMLAFFGRLGGAKTWAALLIFVVATWVCFLPMWHAIQESGVNIFMSRADQIKGAPLSDARGIFGTLTNNLISYMDLYTVHGYDLTLLSIPGEPIMDPFSGLLMFMGLLGAAVAWYQRKMEGALMVGWFIATLAPGVLSDTIPVPYRISLQTPVMFGMAGLAASQLVSFPACKPSRLLATLAGALMCLFAAKSAIWSYNSYFVKYPKDSHSQAYLGGQFTEMGREMKAQPPGTELVVSDAFRVNGNNSEIIRMTSERDYRWASTQISTLFPLQLEKGLGAVLFTEGGLELMAENFQFLYPHSVVKLHRDSSVETFHRNGTSMQTQGNPYCSIYIPAEDVLKSMGCRLVLKTSQGSKVYEGVPLEIPDSYDGPWPVDAEWEGCLNLQGGGRSCHLSGRATGNFKFACNGRNWPLNQNLELGQGMNPFQASWKHVSEETAHQKLALKINTGETINLSDLKNVKRAVFSQGVRVSYYNPLPPRPGQKAGQPNFAENGKPVSSCIEPTVFSRWTEFEAARPRPMPGAYLAVYKASMTVPVGGSYIFYEELGRSHFKVWVDGKLVYPESPQCVVCRGNALKLSKGKHDFKAAFEGVPEYQTGMIAGPALMVQGPDSVPLLLPMAWLQAPSAP